MALFNSSPLLQFCKFGKISLTSDCSLFLVQNLSNFVSLPWKLHNLYCHSTNILTVIMPLPIYQLPTRWKPVQRFPVNCWVELDWSGLMQIFLSLSKPPNLFIIVRCGTPADGLYRLNPTFLFGLYIQLGLKKILGAKINFRVIMKIHFALKLRQILWPSQNIWALTIIVIFG